MALTGVAGLAGLGAAKGAGDGKRTDGPPGARRIERGGIHFRPLGSTGLWLSELSIGGSPPPEVPVLRAALDRGVNYCDSSPVYSRGNSERTIGKAIRGRRDRVLLATKVTPRRLGVATTEDVLRQVDGSLSRLGTDHLDVLCVHGARKPEDLFADWVLEAFARLERAGKARFFGASVHNTTVAFNRRLIESDRYRVLMIPFNMYFDPKLAPGGPEGGARALEEILRLAARGGVGVIVMKSLAAGGLARVPAPEGISPAQAKLRWILKRPEVTAILSEMRTFGFLEENLKASAADLSPVEEAYLRRCGRATARAVCRMCRRCEAVCPETLPVPELLRARMYAVDYGEVGRAAALAGELDAAAGLGRCRRCGRCEAACPWGVRTRTLLDELRAILA